MKWKVKDYELNNDQHMEKIRRMVVGGDKAQANRKIVQEQLK